MFTELNKSFDIYCWHERWEQGLWCSKGQGGFFFFFGGRCGVHLGILVQFVKFALKNYDYFLSLSFWFLTFYSPEFRLKLCWGNLRSLTLWWLLLWLLLWLMLQLSLQLLLSRIVLCTFDLFLQLISLGLLLFT